MFPHNGREADMSLTTLLLVAALFVGIALFAAIVSTPRSGVPGDQEDT
jgi:hypothetical protein